MQIAKGGNRRVNQVPWELNARCALTRAMATTTPAAIAQVRAARQGTPGAAGSLGGGRFATVFQVRLSKARATAPAAMTASAVEI
jgi:hypothetical protein